MATPDNIDDFETMQTSALLRLWEYGRSDFEPIQGAESFKQHMFDISSYAGAAALAMARLYPGISDFHLRRGGVLTGEQAYKAAAKDWIKAGNPDYDREGILFIEPKDPIDHMMLSVSSEEITIQHSTAIVGGAMHRTIVGFPNAAHTDDISKMTWQGFRVSGGIGPFDGQRFSFDPFAGPDTNSASFSTELLDMWGYSNAVPIFKQFGLAGLFSYQLHSEVGELVTQITQTQE